MGWLWLRAPAPGHRPHDLSAWDFLACPSEMTLPLSPQKPRPLTLIKNKPSTIWREKNPPQTASEMIVSLSKTHAHAPTPQTCKAAARLPHKQVAEG